MYASSLLLLSGCFGPPVPEEIPVSFSLTYNDRAGMVNRFETIVIRNREGYREWRRDDSSGKEKFTLTDDELRSLLSVLRENSFHRISTYRMNVRDSGGHSITVSWDGHSRTVTDSGSFFVRKRWRKNWNSIVKAVRECAIRSPNR